MSPEQKTKCRTIIHLASASAAGVGAGLAQIPCSDNAAIVPIQVAMVMSLKEHFSDYLLSPEHIIEGRLLLNALISEIKVSNDEIVVVFYSP